jgi:hypothetical protein
MNFENILIIGGISFSLGRIVGILQANFKKK